MRFYYNEIDDENAFVDNLTNSDVAMMIDEHNEYFGTNYASIDEFNKGEEYREFGAMTKAQVAYAYLVERGYDCMIIGDFVWATIWTHDLEDSMQIMIDIDDPKFND